MTKKFKANTIAVISEVFHALTKNVEGLNQNGSNERFISVLNAEELDDAVRNNTKYPPLKMDSNEGKILVKFLYNEQKNTGISLKDVVSDNILIYMLKNSEHEEDAKNIYRYNLRTEEWSEENRC